MNQQRPRPDYPRRPPPTSLRPPNHNHHHAQHSSNNNPHDEIPAHHRRTLVLSHIPPTLSYHEIRHHFTNTLGMTCDYCTVDRVAHEAYVKLRERDHVLTLWEGGDVLLDGVAGNNSDVHGGNDNGGLSLVKAGVKIKAIHWTNQVPRGGNTNTATSSQTTFEEGKQQQVYYDRKRSWDNGSRQVGEWERGGGERGRGNNNGGRGTMHGRGGRGGGSDHSNKMPRHDYYSTPNSDYNSQHQLQQQQQQQQQQPGSYQSRSSHSFSSVHHPSRDSHDHHHASTNNDTASNSDPSHNNSNHDNSNYSSNQPQPRPPQTSSPTKPIQIHSSQTVHSPAQTSWHRNPQSLSQQQLLQQQQQQQHSQTISTLQQKLVLLQQQESTLQKQLTLQKKMLSVLKQKSNNNNNDNGGTTTTTMTLTKDDQTKKLKEILNTQTKIMELKKERMEGLKELDALKQQQKKFTGTKMMMMRVSNNNNSANNGMNAKKLDMRSKVLKVVGFESGDGLLNEALQKSIQQHFAAYGSVTDVSLQNDDENDESKSPFALITFASRSDAEKAKASDDLFHSMKLTCTWHKPIPTAALTTSDETTGTNEPANNDDVEVNDDALDSYNDIYDDLYEEEETPLDKDGGPDYEDEEEVMVDYD